MHSFLLKNSAFKRCGSVIDLDQIKTMSLKNGLHAPMEEEVKDLDNILQSSTCRRLFTWGLSKDALSCSDEANEKQKEEERLRWNFDFETETPLPGRFQWYRGDLSNGHRENGERNNVVNEVMEHRSTRPKPNTCK